MGGQRKQVHFCAEQVLEQYADMVYRLAIIHMKNKADAEDVFQEVFLRFVKNTDKISTEEHLKAWLIRVTVNCCKKQFDSAWNRHRASLEYDMEGSYEMEEKDESVMEAVQKLPENYRTVIHLFYYEEYSIKEISGLLEQSETAVKTRLSRAREMLRNYLKGEVEYAGTV